MLSSGRRWRGARYAAASIVLSGLIVWLLRSHEVVAPRAPSRDRGALRSEPAPRPSLALERASDGLPIKPAAAGAPVPDGPMHPHPITPAHQRIFRENDLVAALNLAVDLADAARIREALERYRAEYPEDAHRLQEGYAIIAACLEQLDDAARERAQRFWSTEIRSQTRRYVRRYCLERERAS